MTDDQIQELIYAFLDQHGAYVASSSEKELFDLLATVRERCAQIAEATTMDYIDWSPGPAADDRARQIAAAIRAP